MKVTPKKDKKTRSIADLTGTVSLGTLLCCCGIAVIKDEVKVRQKDGRVAEIISFLIRLSSEKCGEVKGDVSVYELNTGAGEKKGGEYPHPLKCVVPDGEEPYPVCTERD